jgi:hypothetical protein
VSALATAAVLPVPARDRARWRDLLAAEWIKLWSLRSTPLVLAALTLLYLYMTWHFSQGTNNAWPSYPAAMRASEYFAVMDAFGGATWFLLMIGAGTVGALTIAGEHASGLIRTTFTAVPQRWRVITAKAAVVLATMTVTGVVISAGTFAIDAAILSARIPGLSFTYPGAWQAIGASVLLVPACALTGMAVAALLRNTPATIFTICVLFILVPVALKSPGDGWTADLANGMPFYAWEALIHIGSAHGHTVGGTDNPTVTGSWITLALWPAAAIIVSVLATSRRDV